jgi:hypothetical protein
VKSELTPPPPPHTHTHTIPPRKGVWVGVEVEVRWYRRCGGEEGGRVWGHSPRTHTTTHMVLCYAACCVQKLLDIITSCFIVNLRLNRPQPLPLIQHLLITSCFILKNVGCVMQIFMSFRCSKFAAVCSPLPLLLNIYPQIHNHQPSVRS